MAKPRDRVLRAEGPPPRCLSAAKLLDFEGQSFSRMVKLEWPANLPLWRTEMVKAANDAKNKASFSAFVSFQAPNPRARSGDLLHDIHLGAHFLLDDPPLAKYSLVIGQKDHADRRRVLRMIHFDLHERFDSQEPKPVLHLQTAGGSWPALLKIGYDGTAFDHLNPSLEKPRIPCLPQCFALLVHVALLEYHSTDERLARFVESRGWLSVVTEAESQVLKPFFHYGNNWLTSAAMRNASLMNCFYGLTPD